jgi:hypothetical protein
MSSADGRETAALSAVLPLEDFSAAKSEDYFADGMNDELITELAKIPSLRIVSRTSIMRTRVNLKSLGRLATKVGSGSHVLTEFSGWFAENTFRDTKDHSPSRADRREGVNEKYADAINNFRRTQLAMEIVCGTAIGKRFEEIDNIFGRTCAACLPAPSARRDGPGSG